METQRKFHTYRRPQTTLTSDVSRDTKRLKNEEVKSPLLTKIIQSSSASSTTNVTDQILFCRNDKVIFVYENLVLGKLVKRYKRFLADIELENGDVITVHCPNTGPMIGLLDLPKAGVILSLSNNPKRKYAHTLEMIQVDNGKDLVWVGVHSAQANQMVGAALRNGWMSEVVGNRKITNIKAEVKHAHNSRIDFVVETQGESSKDQKTFYVEVKSVSLAIPVVNQPSKLCAVFPDTKSTRAQKHVEELIDLQKRKKDIQTIIVFLIQRNDCTLFAPSATHDPAFAALCEKATAEEGGVHWFAYDIDLAINASQGKVVLKSLLCQKP